jgi:thymidylate kinase
MIYQLNPEDNNRVIYICGAHGSGKSTLIEDLKVAQLGKLREQLGHMESLEENISRQIWRAGLHCIEHRENLAYASTLPKGAVVIGDRCDLDDLAYTSAFVELGWLGKEEFLNLRELAEATYKLSGTPKPKRFIILTPPLDWNIARIEERWKNGERVKWNEDNYTYLEAVMNQYQSLAFATGGALSVGETDREERVVKIKKWLAEAKEEDFIVEGRTYTEGVRSSYSS